MDEVWPTGASSKIRILGRREHHQRYVHSSNPEGGAPGGARTIYIRIASKIVANRLRTMHPAKSNLRGTINFCFRTVSSVSFSVMFNGRKLDRFRPTRGIRYGDAISPYLFLLAVESLSCLFKSRSHPISWVLWWLHQLRW